MMIEALALALLTEALYKLAVGTMRGGCLVHMCEFQCFVA